MRIFFFSGLLVSIILVVFLAPFTSSWPDGLEHVAEDVGFMENSESLSGRGLLPDYSVPGLKDEVESTALAGVLGVLIIFGVVYGVGKMIRRKGS